MQIVVLDNNGRIVERIAESAIQAQPWGWLRALGIALDIAKKRDQEIAAGVPKREDDDEP